MRMHRYDIAMRVYVRDRIIAFSFFKKVHLSHVFDLYIFASICTRKNTSLTRTSRGMFALISLTSALNSFQRSKRGTWYVWLGREGGRDNKIRRKWKWTKGRKKLLHCTKIPAHYVYDRQAEEMCSFVLG
jgi:hypothetical protein